MKNPLKKFNEEKGPVRDILESDICIPVGYAQPKNAYEDIKKRLGDKNFYKRSVLDDEKFII